MKKHLKSLRTKMTLIVVFCWVLPILLVALTGGFLLFRSYDRSMRQEMTQAGNNAARQTASRLENLLFESKAVSYDGVVRNAYRLYQTDEDRAALYRTVTSYLKQRFARREGVNAVFLSFWDEPGLMPYMSNQGEDSSRAMLGRYTQAEPDLLQEMADADTSIRISTKDGQLYVARNLLDSRLKPYATVVLLCDPAYLADPIVSLNLIGPARGEIDGICFSPEGSILDSEIDGAEPFTGEYIFTQEAEEHRVVLSSKLRKFDFSFGLKDVSTAGAAVSVLILILLFSVGFFFRRQVSGPVRTLIEATGRVGKGERGYQIAALARSQEFDALYGHFNSMSSELDCQFCYALEEQKALHQAKIKALQSQINPHFLNNTLEIINWEARIAGNEQISGMIEALATMLNTSLNREDRPLITLKEELEYTEAYLYIIRKRMGEGLQVEWRVDEGLLDFTLPGMILQPLVENAVEHDISRSGSGKLEIRVGRHGEELCLWVEHNGHILPEDQAKIDRLLQPEANESGDRVHIGVRNVSQRLHLIYGNKVRLTIGEITDGLIRAEISIPFTETVSEQNHA